MIKGLLMVSVLMLSCMLAGCSGEKTVQTETVTETSTETAAELAQETDADEATENAAETDADEMTESAAETETQAKAAKGILGTFETLTWDGYQASQEIFAEADLTMVNIWATYCSPCISEMPDLGEIADEYADKGFKIVGIITDVYAPGNADAQTIIEHTGADYKHLILSASMLDGFMAQVQVVPTTVFVDSEGKQVGDIYTGSKSKETWCSIIDELLEE